MATRRIAGVLVLVLLVSACSSTTIGEPPEDTNEQVCSNFRDVSAAAHSELLTQEEVERRLAAIHDEAAAKAKGAINRWGLQLGGAAQARDLINRNPNRTLDHLANACNEQFPM